MPGPRHPDPGVLSSVADRLATVRDETRAAADELLEHYVDVGDRATQAAVDTMLDQAADTLRALTDTLADTTGVLRVAARRQVAGHLPAPASGRSGAAAGTGRDGGA